MAADSAPNDELGALRTKVAKLTEINRALMQRVEHGLDLHGNAYHLFQAAILLDRMVRDRTRELEQALEAVATSNRELNEAAVVSMTTQNRLQDAIDSISEGFAIFDPDDRRRVQLAGGGRDRFQGLFQLARAVLHHAVQQDRRLEQVVGVAVQVEPVLHPLHQGAVDLGQLRDLGAQCA